MLPFIQASEMVRSPVWGSERQGYAHELYARSFAESGTTTIDLQDAEATLIRRGIAGSGQHDAMGCYPLFTCERPALLKRDFERLGKDVVSIALVPDPWCGVDSQTLSDIFDIVRPFKTHYVVDLDIPFEAYLRRHHRRYAKRALASAEVSLAKDPPFHAGEWIELYQRLVVRHAIQGPSAFSARSLSLQLEVPGCHYFRAMIDGDAHAALVCFQDRGVAYAHLVSTTAHGQKLCLQYALYWTAIEWFRGQAKWFALGSTPGAVAGDGSSTTGLGFFKAGWATGVCNSYFCGRVQDRNAYLQLCRESEVGDRFFFPGYRTWPGTNE